MQLKGMFLIQSDWAGATSVDVQNGYKPKTKDLDLETKVGVLQHECIAHISYFYLELNRKGIFQHYVRVYHINQ